MKQAVWLLIICIIPAYSPLHAVNEDFDSFIGTYSSIPENFSVSKNGSQAMTMNDEDFRGTKSNSVTTGGCYAWDLGNGDISLGCQPTATDFSPGWIKMTMTNTTDSSFSAISASYDIVSRNNANRSSSLLLRIFTANSTPILIHASSFVTPEQAESNAEWTTTHRSVKIILQTPLNPSGSIQLCWEIDDAGGSGSRDELGINNLSVNFSNPQATVISVR